MSSLSWDEGQKTRGTDGPARPGAYFVFGMSDMQFCKALVRAVKAKTD
jgi:hypothetical protein